MASIRRILSPVPRPSNGEVCLVGSPLSRSSTCTQTNPPPGGLLSSVLDSQEFSLSLFSPRISRPLEKPKHNRGHIWKKSILQFLACFLIGAFIGFTPFMSINNNNIISSNIISKRQDFALDMVSNLQPLLDSKSKSTTETSDFESRVIDNNSNSNDTQESGFESRKLLIIVTPTRGGPFQAYNLNRLSQTLRLVPSPTLWIVVELSSQSSEIAGVLRKTGVVYRHLVCDANVTVTDMGDRNVHQRNVALRHIETHRLDGIVYFADEESIHSTELFDQLRQIRRFGIWRVAKLSGNDNAVLDGPVCNRTEVIGWHVNEPKQRYKRFHAEMSGFGFNSTILWDSKRWHRPMLEPIRQHDTVKNGLQASTFIEQIVEDESQMEGLMRECSTVMVWDLSLGSTDSLYPREWVVKDNLDVTASFIQ